MAAVEQGARARLRDGEEFSQDKANLYVVSLGWYGFLSIFPCCSRW